MTVTMPPLPPPPAPQLDPAALRRLLLVRMDNIGDMVMMTPTLRALRRTLPAAEITLLTSPAGARVMPMLPWIDDVIVHSALWQQLTPREGVSLEADLALVKELRRRRLDAALVFTSFTQSPHPPAFACLLAGIGIRAGQPAEFGGQVLTHAVTPPPRESHQVDRNLHLLEALGLLEAGGVPSHDRHMELRPAPDARAEADELLRQRGIGPDEDFVALAPAASCPARSAPPRLAAAVARRCVELLGCRVAILGGDRPAEGEIEAAVASAVPAGLVPSLLGRTSVPVLASVLGRARLAVTVNSGALHLADAMGTPQLVLFSGTDRPSQWAPRAAPAAVLTRPTSCSPCHLLDCPFDRQCLDLDLDRVDRELTRLWGQAPAPAGEPPGGEEAVGEVVTA